MYVYMSLIKVAANVEKKKRKEKRRRGWECIEIGQGMNEL